MEQMFSLYQAAVRLGIKIRTARSWVHSGKLKAIKYPGSNRWFVPESEMRRLLGEHGNKD